MVLLAQDGPFLRAKQVAAGARRATGLGVLTQAGVGATGARVATRQRRQCRTGRRAGQGAHGGMA
jgi:hypothetical protein